MKKLYVGSNLKMYKGIEETIQYLKTLVENLKDINNEELKLFIIPSYTALPDAIRCIDKKDIQLGAQNMCWEEQGQFTGEISPCMLEEMGIDLVMIGHSERRHVFGETNVEVNSKVKMALKHKFRTLLCVGETADDKQYGITEEVIKSQIKVGLYGVESNQIEDLWIAYEPVWSIGVNGTPATADYAEYVHNIIKKILKDLFGDIGKTVPVLYGGSVNQNNTKQLIEQPSIDGLFVGRAAWDANKFDTLIRTAKENIDKKTINI